MVLVRYKLIPGNGSVIDLETRLAREPMLHLSLEADARDPGYIVSCIPCAPGHSVLVYEIMTDGDGDARVIWRVNTQRYGLKGIDG